MSDWTHGPVILYFKGCEIYVTHRPKLKAIDLNRYDEGKRRSTYLGRYSDDLSKWTVTDMMKKKYKLEEEDEGEEE